ncbi:MAG: hypothetical protein IT406_00130 [Candidatus Yanofskybacteria bacterium]|nr:hypothetical protein [Candidatus Yanofskybacteria bacterium]
MTKFIEHRTGRRRPSKKIAVLYHKGCTDGFGAAWAAFRSLGKSAEYIPVEHQTPPPDGLTGKTIYLLDFTYTRDVMERLIRDNVRVTALDHHLSSRAETEMTEDFRYSQDHSGAVVAWEYFHPGVPVPFILQVIEDIDLHRFALPDSATVSDWLDVFDFDFKVYTKLARTLASEAGRRRALRHGAFVQQYRTKCVDRLISNNSYEVDFEGQRVLAVTSELFHSEIGSQLAVGRPFSVVWRMRSSGPYVSLRSAPEGANVAEIALRYGGGGHAHAAGFKVARLEDLPFRPVREVLKESTS